MASGQLLSRRELEHVLLAKFHAAVAAGLTRTKDVTKTRWAVLGPPVPVEGELPPGSVEWVRSSLTAQFNEEHIAAKRKSHMHAAAAPPSVVAPFDSSRFHFGKVDPAEVLFAVRLAPDHEARVALDVPPPAATALLQGEPTALREGNTTAVKQSDAGAGSLPGGTDATASGVSDVWHPVLVNASPICVPHALLVPWPGKRLPQVMTPAALRVALATAALPGAASLRLAFNSLGAWSSVNHLHWHIIPAAFSGRAKGGAGAGSAEEAPSEHQQEVLPVEVSPREEEESAGRTGDGTLNVAALEICGRGVVNLEEGWDPITAEGLADQLREVRLPAAQLGELCREAGALVRAWAEGGAGASAATAAGAGAATGDG